MRQPIALFRADASTDIGTGHVVRCRTLATALAAYGWRTVLAAAQAPSSLRADWPGGAANTILLDVDMPAGPEPEELAVLSAALGGPADLVVVDHYGIDARWCDAARTNNSNAVLMAIDDLADRPLGVDIVLNQNLGVEADAYRTLVPAPATVLIGPAYALVRPEFAVIRDRGERRRERVDRVLVMFGGADRSDVTLRAVHAVAAIGVPSDVVVGAAYPHLPRLANFLAAEVPAARLHVNTSAIAELADAASLAIGAPGSASWERCALGLPSLLVTLADNQLAVGRALDRLGAAELLGWHEDVAAGTIEAAVRRLQTSPSRLASMSAAAMAVTDGRGTDRVVATILAADSRRMAVR